MIQTRKRSGLSDPSTSERTGESSFTRDSTEPVRQSTAERRYLTAPVGVMSELSTLHQYRLALLLLELPRVEKRKGSLSARWFGGSYQGRMTLAELWDCSPKQVTNTLTELRRAGVDIELWNDASRRHHLRLWVPLSADRRAQLPVELRESSPAAVVVYIALQRFGADQSNASLRARTGLGRNTVREALRSLEQVGLRDPDTGVLAIIRGRAEKRQPPPGIPATAPAAPALETGNPPRSKGAPAVEETVEIHPSLSTAFSTKVELEHQTPLESVGIRTNDPAQGETNRRGLELCRRKLTSASQTFGEFDSELANQTDETPIGEAPIDEESEHMDTSTPDTEPTPGRVPGESVVKEPSSSGTPAKFGARDGHGYRFFVLCEAS